MIQTLAESIRGALLYEEPWPHIIITDVFSSDQYDALMEETNILPTYHKKGRLVRYLKSNRNPFAAAACSPTVRRELKNRLGFLGNGEPEIVCDREGYESKVHQDVSRKVGTLQVYMTRDAIDGHGTKLWARDKSSIVKEVPYAPNVGYAFQRLNDSWHSFGPIRFDRWSFIAPYMK